MTGCKSTDPRQMNITKNRLYSKDSKHKDDKQRQFPESKLQNHCVLFVKLIRNVHQQGLVTFR